MQEELYFGYLRVSTDGQAESGLGLEGQRLAIQAEADRRGWALEWIADPATSGGDFERPGLQLALERLKAGEAKGLVVHKVDRLARDLHDQTLIQRSAKKDRWDLVVVDLPTDTSTADGELLLHFRGALSQWETRLISQRTKDALAVKKAQGQRLGRPVQLPEEVRLEIHHQRQTLDSRGKPTTLRAIAERLNADGVPRASGKGEWTPQAVAKVLHSVALDLHAKEALKNAS